MITKKTLTYDVIIIGGGPAGLFTALHLPKKYSCLLLEKNQTYGRKLLMSGSGRCNLTHAGNIQDFFNHYGDHSRFLRTAFTLFSNQDLISFCKEKKCPLTIDKNGKVFPASNNAADILHMLIKEIEKNKTTIHCHEPVRKLEKQETGFTIETETHKYYATIVVLATGGKSYPASGSTGDGYTMAKLLGHTIIPPKPALTPVFIRNFAFPGWAGISLPHRTISLYRDNKKIKEHTGDIGFTHKGLSGPGILDFSRYMEKNDKIEINLIQKNSNEFTEIFIQTCSLEGKIGLKTFLKRFDLPENLLKDLLFSCQLNTNHKLAQLTKHDRTTLIDTLCRFPLIIESLGGFHMAMVTCGGIALHEVSAKTMASKLIKNLFFAGEILDIDGDTGGYNLQAAFSTAYLAAHAIKETLTHD